ncbi:MAG: hypothetical protein VYA30_14840 [Myxococcota bacterium]|nr:hypothetical protein [Myxococcota bacterium]
MSRACFTVITLATILNWGCDDSATSPGNNDCRRAEYACADGYRCIAIGGGRYDCVTARDAMIAPDMLAVTDAAAVSADMTTQEERDTGSLMMDIGMIESDAHMGFDMTSPADDASGFADGMRPQPDQDVVDAFMGDEQDFGQAEDASAPIVDASVTDAEDIDEGRLDLAVPDPVDIGVPEPMDVALEPEFGPGRCDYNRVIPREQRDLGGQDQNGAMALMPGRYQGLTVGGIDFADWYRTSVCAGGTITIEIRHPFTGVDLELDVWHPREGRLGQSTSLCSGGERFRWVNDGNDVEIRFNVYPWAPPGRNGNNSYVMDVQVQCDR